MRSVHVTDLFAAGFQRRTQIKLLLPGAAFVAGSDKTGERGEKCARVFTLNPNHCSTHRDQYALGNKQPSHRRTSFPTAAAARVEASLTIERAAEMNADTGAPVIARIC